MEELARVYARSLFEAAKQQGKLDELREQLVQFADALEGGAAGQGPASRAPRPSRSDGNRDLQIFFFSPYFSTKEKQEALAHLLVDADPQFVNFLELLIENHRMPVIFRIRRSFEQLWEQENRLLPVEITSAIELDDATTGSVVQRIGESTGRHVTLTTRVDPAIIGGIVVRVGNSILDASIRNRLEQLRRQVAHGASA
jgi:F-type H+-transporting ATPase subunit delta